MDELLKKLNYKPPVPVTVLGAPPQADEVLKRWSEGVEVRTRLGKNAPFVVAFVRQQADVAKRAPAVAKALADDGVLWMAYPKKSSKRYSSDLSRDDGWQPLGDLGYEAVRQVAIDEDWSALRFRPAAKILRLTRDPSGALSAEGKRRISEDPAVTAYLEGLPPERRSVVTKLHQLIRDAAPELQPAVWKGMLGYGKYHYRYASGREGDSYAVALASQKQCVSLYLMTVVDGRYVAEANADRLGKVSVGKSCVRFKKLEDLDLDVVQELVRVTAARGPQHDSGGS